MTNEPIYLHPDAEIPELIDRLRRTQSFEVPVVLPPHSRLGQSRFNFELLQHYAGRLGKRIVVVSPDEGARQMAQEAGLLGFAALGEYEPGRGSVTAPSAASGMRTATVAPPVRAPEAPAYSAADFTPLAAEPDPFGAERLSSAMVASAPARHRSLAGPASTARLVNPPRLQRPAFYIAAAVIMLAGLIAMAIFVPSAQVTLVAPAKAFTENFTLTASPGHAPVSTRAITTTSQVTQTFPTTGKHVIPAVAAKGTVYIQYSGQTGCASGYQINQGDTVSGGGQEFSITSPDTTVGGKPNQPATSTPLQVQAVTPGSAGNVPANTIKNVDNVAPPSQDILGDPCLTVDQTQSLTGGVDQKTQPQMSQDDYNNARLALQKQLQQQVTSDLQKQVKSGEKMADKNIVFEPPTLTTDHNVGDIVSNFTAAMSLKGDASVYNDASVHRALATDLRSKVKPGYQMTDNQIQSTYSVTDATGDGQVTFQGSATGYEAPVLDFSAIKSHLAGHSQSTAHSYLKALPVTSATFTQSPFALPVLPWLSSRIQVRYVVEQGQAAQNSA